MAKRLQSLLLPDCAVRRIQLRRLQRIGRVSFGRHTYGVPTVVDFDNDDVSRLVIGSFCSIASGVTFLLGGNHPLDRVTTFPIRARWAMVGAGTDGYPSSKGDISVGNDVWIAHGSTIVSGVKIGDGAVIAAGSVVTGDVPSYSIVAGTPAKVVRARLSREQSEAVAAIAWWDWPDTVIAAEVDHICSADIDGFIEKFRR